MNIQCEYCKGNVGCEICDDTLLVFQESPTSYRNALEYRDEHAPVFDLPPEEFQG